jgi:hypothetical protein
MEEIKTEELLKELENRGFKQGYLSGHGTDEAVTEGEFVIADVEKCRIIIFPQDVWKEPVNINDYF